jgi:Ca-activated chloride channel homolog
MKIPSLIIGSLFMTIYVDQVSAFSWQDLWSTKNQQAQTLMQQGKFKQAKEAFQQQDWKAAAAYRAGAYEEAASLYGVQRSEPGYYNQGNALAHIKKYKEAIQAYDKALKINPNNQDAVYNKKVVQALLNQDKQQQDKQDQDKQEQDKQEQDKQEQDKQEQDKQDQDKQDQDKQDQDKQDQDKQEQDKQEKDKQEQDKSSNPEQKDKNKQQAEESKQTKAEREQDYAKEQWLKLVPDDPGGLMREKFLRDHLRRQRGWY